MRRKSGPVYVPLDQLPAGYAKRWLGFKVLRVVRPEAGPDKPSRDPIHRFIEWWLR